MLERLQQLDNTVFLALNGSDSAFWDAYMWLVSSTLTWIPVFLMLLFIIAKNSNARRMVLIVVALALVILLADRLSSGLLKPLFQRLRPTHTITFMHTIDTVFGYQGGRYGFVSSHAANTFSVFIFLSLLFRNRLMTFSLLCWAVLSSYSRVYLGVHYPGDILCGAFLGLLVGVLVYFIYKISSRYTDRERQYYSSAYTSSGFLISDIHLLAFTLVATYCVLFIIATFLAMR